jgi:hypothetical protein
MWYFIFGAGYLNPYHEEMFVCVALGEFDAYASYYGMSSRPPLPFSPFFSMYFSESIQLSVRLSYTNAKCVCADGAMGTILKKMS